MQPTAVDPSFLFKREKGDLVGMKTVVVDDTMCAGTSGFAKQEEIAVQKFLSNAKEKQDFVLTGLAVHT